jgi:hypothetical protein
MILKQVSCGNSVLLDEDIWNDLFYFNILHYSLEDNDCKSELYLIISQCNYQYDFTSAELHCVYIKIKMSYNYNISYILKHSIYIYTQDYLYTLCQNVKKKNTSRSFRIVIQLVYFSLVKSI